MLVILPAAQSDDTPTASGLQAYQNKEEDEHDYNRKESRNHQRVSDKRRRYRFSGSTGCYPVSYTHLDVYKRQVLQLLGFQIINLALVQYEFNKADDIQRGNYFGEYTLSLIHI